MRRSAKTSYEELGISVENVVASVTLDQKIDLLDIMKVFRTVEYRPTQVPGLVCRSQRPKPATLSCALGKMGCTGASLRGWRLERSTRSCVSLKTKKS